MNSAQVTVVGGPSLVLSSEGQATLGLRCWGVGCFEREEPLVLSAQGFGLPLAPPQELSVGFPRLADSGVRTFFVVVVFLWRMCGGLTGSHLINTMDPWTAHELILHVHTPSPTPSWAKPIPTDFCLLLPQVEDATQRERNPKRGGRPWRIGRRS